MGFRGSSPYLNPRGFVSLMTQDKWRRVKAGGSAFGLLAHMVDRGKLGIIHCNVCEEGFKSGIPLVMDFEIFSGGVLGGFQREFGSLSSGLLRTIAVGLGW